MATNKELEKQIELLSNKLTELTNTPVQPTPVVVPPEVATVSKFKSCLQPGITVTISVINRGAIRTIIDNTDDKSMGSMLKGTTKTICLPLEEKIYRLVDPLTIEEKAFLEDATGLNLNVNSKTGIGKEATFNNFYVTRAAKLKFKKTSDRLDSADLVLDLGDPIHYILYKIALKSPEVAKRWEDRFDPKYTFVIKDSGAMLGEKITKSEKSDTVFGFLLANKTKKKSLLNILRLYGAGNYLPIKVSYNKPTEWLYIKLKEIIEDINGLNAIYNIINTDEGKFNDLVLIQDAIDCGAIEKHGREYKEGDSKQLLGQSANEVIVFLSKAENQSSKMYINNKVQTYLQDKFE